MTDKFAEYYDYGKNQKRVDELSDYVHLNMKMIATKMQSEMRRELDIKPDLENSEGYVSLMVSLYGRMFNEIVYCLSGLCLGSKIKLQELIPQETLIILFNLLEGKYPTTEELMARTKITKEEFNEYYLKNIDSLRKNIETLPNIDKEEK